MLFLLSEQDGLENKLAQIKHVIRLSLLPTACGTVEKLLIGGVRPWQAEAVTGYPKFSLDPWSLALSLYQPLKF